MGPLMKILSRILNTFRTEWSSSIKRHTKAIIKEDLLKNGSTMSKLTNDLTLIMGLEQGYDPKRDEEYRNVLNQYLTKTQAELPKRTIKDSYLYGIVPLSTDVNLQGLYLSNDGHLRYGRLMEDLDMFAGDDTEINQNFTNNFKIVFVLQKYLLNPKVPPGQPYPYTIVTIMVDTMMFSDYISKANRDVRISGHVCTVGASSAEIIIWLDQYNDDKWNKITESRFWMAARNTSNTGKAFINPLKLVNIEEEALMTNAKQRRLDTQRRNEQSLLKVLPTEAEQKILHKLFTKTTMGGMLCKQHKDPPEGYKWMHQTKVQNSVLSFPEHRNLHNTVFGGFIMRQAIELAYTTCFLFAERRGKLFGISEVLFHKPVPVGSIIQMYAQINYTHEKFVQIFVHVDTMHMKTKTESSNTLQCTFVCPEPVLGVCPCSYKEAMMYINGMRHFNKTLELREKDRGIVYIDFHRAK